MKAKDIRPGVVYGYRRGKYGSVEPVVFLAKPGPDQIYACPRHTRSGEPIYSHSQHARAPVTGRGFGSVDYGYAAVFADTEPTTEVIDEMTKTTLGDFLAATKGHDPERGIRYGLVTVPARVVGPYEDAVTEEKRQWEAQRRQHHEDEARREAVRERVERIIAALRAHGVTSFPENWHEPGAMVIPLDDVEKLIALLGGERL
jgi:hypothetical protein